MGDRFELKNNRNVNNEAYSKASYLYRASYTQQNHTLPFHGLYSKRADKLLKHPYSILRNKTENTLSLLMITHSYRIFSDVKIYVRVAKSQNLFCGRTVFVHAGLFSVGITVHFLLCM
jgi:hypothetical protein